MSDYNSALLWICGCCMLTLTNGECCPDGHEYEPLRLVSSTENITLGMLAEQHSCEDPYNTLCDCENYGFSTNSCPTCGTQYFGDRYAATCWWTEEYI